MWWPRFALVDALGGALWVGVWVSLGYVSGNHIDTVYSVVRRYLIYVLIAAALVLLALLACHLVRRRNTDSHDNDTDGSGGSGVVTAG